MLYEIRQNGYFNYTNYNQRQQNSVMDIQGGLHLLPTYKQNKIIIKTLYIKMDL